MARVNSKEAKYIGVSEVSRDPMQVEESIYINPTYNLVNWMRVRNASNKNPNLKDVSPDVVEHLDFGRTINMSDGSEVSLFAYIDEAISDWNLNEKNGRKLNKKFKND